MADISRQSSGKARNTSGTTLTASADLGLAPGALIVGVSTGEVNTGDLITGVTCGGVPMTRIGVAFQSVGSLRPVYIYALLNPPAGVSNIVVTRSNSGIKELTWVCYNNVASLHGAVNAQRITSPTMTRTVTTTVPGCWLVDCGIIARSQTVGPGTLNLQMETNTHLYDSDGPRAAGANSLVTTQSDSAQSAWVTIALEPTGGAPNTTNFFPFF
jgi:hypothetical protein